MMKQQELFSKLEQHYKKKLPFAIFKYPDAHTIKAVFQKDNQLNTTNTFTETGFVFAPFDLDKTSAVVLPYKESDVINVAFNKRIGSTTAKTTISQHYDEKYHHTELVKKGISELQKNKLEKVVLSRCEHIPIQELNIVTLYKRLLHTSHHFVYAFYHPKVGQWLGATPEVLLHVKQRELHTMALAGTKLVDAHWTTKEKHEQQIVTDYIVDAIAPLTTSINISALETITTGSIQHLRTRITALLKKEALLSTLIHYLHPTPAVCGLPKKESKSFIINHESYHREFYTGFLGELHVEKSSHLFVNLRCMQLKDKNALIYVGGGITKASIAENEWEETVKKTKAMLQIL